MASRWPSLNDLFSALFRGNFGARLGPGALRTVASVAVAGFLSIALVAWALSAVPWLAVVAIAGIGLLLYYLVDRTFRYAEENPVPALLSGGELGKLSERQMAASKKSVVVDAPPMVGASAGAIGAQLDSKL